MNGILKCSGDGTIKNIGDFIQSVAQEQFWDHTDCFVERENLNSFKAEEQTNVIMNAWFMWNPQNFPPSSVINPLFISFHIVPNIASQMLTQEAIKYLKKYEPIGARDTGTRDLLNEYGISSYFSGCLTLTLGERYKSSHHNNNVIFVDPYYEFGGGNNQNIFTRHLKGWFYFFKYRSKIKSIKNKFHCEFHYFYRHWPSLEKNLMVASFYHSYSKMFNDDILQNATYLTHEIPQSKYPTDVDKMQLARKLVKTYASAKLVVTSRIHCALPCLAVETPVIFINSDALQGNSVRSSGRFGGLIELLHVAKWTNRGVCPESDELKTVFRGGKIGMQTVITNLKSYLFLKERLISTIKHWQKGTINYNHRLST